MTGERAIEPLRRTPCSRRQVAPRLSPICPTFASLSPPVFFDAVTLIAFAAEGPSPSMSAICAGGHLV